MSKIHYIMLLGLVVLTSVFCFGAEFTNHPELGHDKAQDAKMVNDAYKYISKYNAEHPDTKTIIITTQESWHYNYIPIESLTVSNETCNQTYLSSDPVLVVRDLNPESNYTISTHGKSVTISASTAPVVGFYVQPEIKTKELW